MIEVRIYDESYDYLFELCKTDNADNALAWLCDRVNRLQRPVKIRVYHTSNEQKEKGKSRNRQTILKSV